MAQEELERLIGRAILDPEFRKRLLVDPETAIQKEGFDLTPEEVELVKSVDKDKAETLAEEIGATPEAAWK